jgi:Domain of unknown function (DUF4333)
MDPRRAAKGATAIGVGAVIAALALSSCSIKARDTVSAASLEAEIAAQLASTFHISKPKVHCPRSVPAQAGSKFACSTHLYGQALKVEGKVTGSRGQVEVKPANAVVNTVTAETELAKRLQPTFHHPVKVSCSVPPLLVATAGRGFRCTATIGDIKRQLAVTVTGNTGALSYRVLPYKASK